MYFGERRSEHVLWKRFAVVCLTAGVLLASGGCSPDPEAPVPRTVISFAGAADRLSGLAQLRCTVDGVGHNRGLAQPDRSRLGYERSDGPQGVTGPDDVIHHQNVQTVKIIEDNLVSATRTDINRPLIFGSIFSMNQLPR